MITTMTMTAMITITPAIITTEIRSRLRHEPRRAK